ncbi:hypothetical protein EDB83DRAFT_1871476 [Lactarius deliciosus]|nr:hypothetical protein EDB83DRAFT_1871476 [Lactarius deliciosus]
MDPNSTPPPQPSSQSRPRVQSHKPRSICRNFVYHGVCKDTTCPRAHVPHSDMLDLVTYLMERNDFPPELRSVKQRLTPPNPSLCRGQLPSDRICRNFVPRPCPLRERCLRTHFSVANIYGSLLQPAKSQRAKPHEADVAPQLESDARSP